MPQYKPNGGWHPEVVSFFTHQGRKQFSLSYCSPSCCQGPLDPLGPLFRQLGSLSWEGRGLCGLNASHAALKVSSWYQFEEIKCVFPHLNRFRQPLRQSKKAKALSRFFSNACSLLTILHSERVHKGNRSAHLQALEWWNGISGL